MKEQYKISGDSLLEIGFPEGKSIGIALQLIGQHYDSMDHNQILAELNHLVRDPDGFLSHPWLSALAQEIINSRQVPDPVIPLKDSTNEFKIYGAGHIEDGAFDQMKMAMKLPITVSGALMPDAHQGYGLPIGGVLATDHAVIPYGVGVDIGCRMALSIYDIPAEHLVPNMNAYKRELIAWTKFGAGAGWQGKFRADHDVLDKPAFNATKFISGLRDKAVSQLGTSGGGNHFVEFGIMTFEKDDEQLNIRQGEYVALLSHSGSRGFGATIANHYSRLAQEHCKLPKEAAHLAYLDLDSAEGQEYWLAMNLAGDYASACHDIIHQRLTKAIGGAVLARVENHHNFAWKEKWKGKDVIVHRKGATPASKNVLGIIPGSMTAPGYLVRGKGIEESINSASHGAGRQMSRTQATKNLTHENMRKILKEYGVTLIGAGLDEAPMAYKDIEVVMAAQQELVDVIAKFQPKLVRMADDGSRED